MAEHDIKVGDELAFKVGYGVWSWMIHKVTKITPTGRVKCGPYTLNPDLSRRGDTGHTGPYKGEPVTDTIRQSIERQKLLMQLQRMVWRDFPTDVLQGVIKVIQNVQAEGHDE